MENASKALIMAGAVLIALLIVSLGVLIFRNYADSAKKSANMDKQEISEFNSKISPYVRNTISGSEVNALIQLVISINNNCISSNDDTKQVVLEYTSTKDSASNLSIKIVKEGDKYKLNTNGRTKVQTGASYYYKVTADYSDNGLINKITITDK